MKADEIKPWTHIYEAREDYTCSLCGHTIYATTIYTRRVMRERCKGRFLVVHREHHSCPDECSSTHLNW